MANFRAYPGLLVEFVKDAGDCKIGQRYQVLGTRFNITLIGSNTVFTYEQFAKAVKPIPGIMYTDEVMLFVDNDKNKGGFNG